MKPETLTSELISIRRRRAECIAALISLSEEQQALLVDGRHSDLADNLAGFDPLLLELSQLDKREEAVSGHLDKAVPEGATSRTSDEIRDLDGMIAAQVERLHTLTTANRRLLGDAMELVDFTISIICKAATDARGGAGDAACNNPLVMDTRA